jgi:tyrosyl-tRNA synthetase
VSIRNGSKESQHACEYANIIQPTKKPIILSHHMILDLKEGQEKMSKSDPDSAEVTRKINKAFCPPGLSQLMICFTGIRQGLCMDYMKHIVFKIFNTV